MDTATRLGRYMVEELVGTPETSVQEAAASRYVNTSIIVVVAFFLLGSGRWEDLWTLFGGANQLLAAMALLTVTVWLANWDATKQLISTGIPMALMATVTVCALLWVAFYQVLGGRLLGITAEAETSLLGQASAVVQMGIGLVLIGLALSLIWMGYGNIQNVRGIGGERTVAADGGEAGDD